MNDKVKYWTELSDYDYDTALAMLNTGRYLYDQGTLRFHFRKY